MVSELASSDETVPFQRLTAPASIRGRSMRRNSSCDAEKTCSQSNVAGYGVR